MKNSKQYGIFEQVEFLNEGAAVVPPLILTAAVTGAMALMGLIEKKKRRNDKKAAEEAERAAKESREKQKKLDIFLADFKKHYWISVQKLSKDKQDRNSPGFYNDILKDAKDWANKIKNSNVFKDISIEIINSEDFKYIKEEYPDSYKIDVNHFKSIINAKKSDYIPLEEGIEISDGAQVERLKFIWVWEDIAKLIHYKYGINTHVGDGDEGFVYYNQNRVYKPGYDYCD